MTAGHARRPGLLRSAGPRVWHRRRAHAHALEAAALLHDVGKIGIPEHILNKPGKLTAEEYDVKGACRVGVEILSGIEFPFPVVPIVKSHHENWNGTGYPMGLRGGRSARRGSSRSSIASMR